ncbi:MAG: oligosaccharide flippase family protein [Oscillospiraceae bacterium]|jgi:stage V sporulation protein B|nr:oligosaccharide flippase family protein [Oscillospiraceae bacterium]
MKRLNLQKNSLLSQTLILTAANFAVRMLGFVMRIWLSRTLGAEAIGVMELASSAHMLWIAPVASGLPMAVSRFTAQAYAARDPLRARQTLEAGKKLAKIISWSLFAVCLLLSPIIAHILGDSRTLPTLLLYLPCLPILALSAVYNGYCYGAENTTPPAVSEIIEQALRFGICFTALSLLPAMKTAYSAAIPVAGMLVGEAVGLWLVIRMINKKEKRGKSEKVQIPSGMMSKLWRLAFPMTCMRMSNTLVRSVNAALIPMRLRASGVAASQATAMLGMYNGMALSLIMLPAVFTGALSMVSAPAITKRENNPQAMRRLLKRVLVPAFFISLISAIGIYFLAPFISKTLYRQAELEQMLRMLTPCVVMMGLQQVIGGLIAGLGEQRRALYASLSGSLLTVGLNFWLAGIPTLRLTGVAIATEVGMAVTLVMSARVLVLAVTRVGNRRCLGLAE